VGCGGIIAPKAVSVVDGGGNWLSGRRLGDHGSNTNELN